jgi:hypothetical protein
MVTKQKAIDFPINSWVVFTKDLSELDIKKGTTGTVYSEYYKHKFLVKVSVQKGNDWYCSYWVPKDSIELTQSYLNRVSDDIKLWRTYAQNEALYIASNIGAIKKCIDSEEPDYQLMNNFSNHCKSLLERLQDLNNKKRLLI